MVYNEYHLLMEVPKVMSNKVKLLIGGFEYSILADQGEEAYYYSLADQLNQRIEELSRSSHFSTAMAAVFAALESCDNAKKASAELVRLQREHEGAAIQNAGFQSKAKEIAARYEKLQEDFKTAVEEAACARLEADQANRELMKLRRELASPRDQAQQKNG